MSKTAVFLLLFLIALVIYSGSINGEFLLDDKILIAENVYIKSLKYIPLLFSTDVFFLSVNNFEKTYNYYRPLQTLSFSLDYRIWGMDTFGYHLTNIILHSLIAFLVFCLLLRLFSDFWLALLSSVIFCAHPIHTESVSFISGRSELLVSLFTLMTMLFYVKYLDSRKGVMFIIAIFSFVLAFISKEAGFLAIVPFFILFAGSRAKIPKSSLFIHFLTFSGLIVIYAMLRLTILVPLKMLPYTSPSGVLDVINFSRAIAEYARLLIFPENLHIFRTIPAVHSVKWFYLALPAGIFILGIAALILSIRRKNFVFIFAVSWFVLLQLHLLRTMHKFNVDISIEEHWVYLASIGFFVLLAYFILRLKKFRAIAGLSIVIIYGVLTFVNSLHWRETLDFYRYNLERVRQSLSFIPHFNYATALKEKGLFKEALIETESLLKMAPGRFGVYILQGDIYKKMGKYDAAENAYRQALRLDRLCWQANLKLKSLARDTGRPYKEEIEPWLSPQEARVVSRIMNGEFYDAIMDADRAGVFSYADALYA